MQEINININNNNILADFSNISNENIIKDFLTSIKDNIFVKLSLIIGSNNFTISNIISILNDTTGSLYINNITLSLNKNDTFNIWDYVYDFSDVLNNIYKYDITIEYLIKNCETKSNSIIIENNKLFNYQKKYIEEHPNQNIYDQKLISEIDKLLQKNDETLSPKIRELYRRIKMLYITLLLFIYFNRNINNKNILSSFSENKLIEILNIYNNIKNELLNISNNNLSVLRQTLPINIKNEISSNYLELFSVLSYLIPNYFILKNDDQQIKFIKPDVFIFNNINDYSRYNKYIKKLTNDNTLEKLQIQNSNNGNLYDLFKDITFNSNFKTLIFNNILNLFNDLNNIRILKQILKNINTSITVEITDCVYYPLEEDWKIMDDFNIIRKDTNIHKYYESCMNIFFIFRGTKHTLILKNKNNIINEQDVQEWLTYNIDRFVPDNDPSVWVKLGCYNDKSKPENYNRSGSGYWDSNWQKIFVYGQNRDNHYFNSFDECRKLIKRVGYDAMIIKNNATNEITCMPFDINNNLINYKPENIYECPLGSNDAGTLNNGLGQYTESAIWIRVEIPPYEMPIWNYRGCYKNNDGPYLTEFTSINNNNINEIKEFAENINATLIESTPYEKDPNKRLNLLLKKEKINDDDYSYANCYNTNSNKKHIWTLDKVIINKNKWIYKGCYKDKLNPLPETAQNINYTTDIYNAEDCKQTYTNTPTNALVTTYSPEYYNNQIRPRNQCQLYKKEELDLNNFSPDFCKGTKEDDAKLWIYEEEVKKNYYKKWVNKGCFKNKLPKSPLLVNQTYDYNSDTTGINGVIFSTDVDTANSCLRSVDTNIYTAIATMSHPRKVWWNPSNQLNNPILVPTPRIQCQFGQTKDYNPDDYGPQFCKTSEDSKLWLYETISLPDVISDVIPEVTTTTSISTPKEMSYGPWEHKGCWPNLNALFTNNSARIISETRTKVDSIEACKKIAEDKNHNIIGLSYDYDYNLICATANRFDNYNTYVYPYDYMVNKVGYPAIDQQYCDEKWYGQAFDHIYIREIKEGFIDTNDINKSKSHKQNKINKLLILFIIIIIILIIVIKYIN